jgi:hypothetical protein
VTLRVVVAFGAGCLLTACAAMPPVPHPTPAPAPRTFVSGFESINDFRGMYISPQTASTRHALVSSPRRRGKLAHCGWLTGPGSTADVGGPNHRGYPTQQLYKLPGGGFATPAVVDLWVWADVQMKFGEWVSLATLSPDATDAWSRVVTVNIDPGGWLNVFHVPNNGQHEVEYETHKPFPMRKWVHLKITIDFDPQHGFVEVRQNGVKVARAKVNGGSGRLEQAHFGMYAIASMTSGKVCNDDLQITAAATPPASSSWSRP